MLTTAVRVFTEKRRPKIRSDRRSRAIKKMGMRRNSEEPDEIAQLN